MAGRKQEKQQRGKGGASARGKRHPEQHFLAKGSVQCFHAAQIGLKSLSGFRCSLRGWVTHNGRDSPSWAALGCWGSPEPSPDWQQPRAGDRDSRVLGHLSFWRVLMGACACAGATCEDVLAPCAGSPCKNGGECQESEDYKSFSCSCPPGWQGMAMALLGVRTFPSGMEGQRGGSQALGRVLTCPMAELGGWDTTNCIFGFCPGVNGAQDVIVTPGAFTSTPSPHSPCPALSSGQTCEIDINECVKSPCRNGATCQNTNGSYRCACRTGFSGRNCDTDIDDCKPSKSRGCPDCTQPSPEPHHPSWDWDSPPHAWTSPGCHCGLGCPVSPV